MSGKKWTLPKNQGDPHRDTSETQSHSGQQTNTKALILKENDVSKCLWNHTKDPGSLYDVSKSDSKVDVKDE